MFQFDFLNDDFTKLPQSLQDIVNDAEKRKKLVIYINPPYAESGNKEVLSGKGKNKSEVALSKTYDKYQSIIGTATRELFTQFLARIYAEIPSSKIANFSTLKNLQSSNFARFRDFFLASLESVFLVPADTFDNVKGQFPIGFFIWNTEKKETFNGVVADIYNHEALYVGIKTIHPTPKGRLSVDWLRQYFDKQSEIIGYVRLHRNDIQNKDAVFITSNPSQSDFDKKEVANMTLNNLVEMSIYCVIRQAVEATWLNDRDQFLFPSDDYKTDIEFQNDCLAFALFNNNIQSKYCANLWIPFTEQEVNAKEKFASHFMTDFINGKLKAEQQAQNTLFGNEATNNAQDNQARQFSAEATAVFDAGRALWRYYHAQPNVNVNASYYDIREYFQGRNAAGRMNSTSLDEKYTALIGDLRAKLNVLADKIKPKIYEYGFLKA